MNFDARLKKVEEQAREKVKADFCLCILGQEASRAFQAYLSARGVAYEPENPYIVTHPCHICQRELSSDLTVLDEEERAVWHRLFDWAQTGWEEKRRTGRNPEVPEEFARLEKWLLRRCMAAEERVFGRHCQAAVIFAYRQAKELFPFAAKWIDKEIREREEAWADEVEANGSKWKP